MAAHDIPRCHAYIKVYEDTDLDFMMEATLSLIFLVSQLRARQRHVRHPDKSAVHFHFSHRVCEQKLRKEMK